MTLVEAHGFHPIGTVSTHAGMRVLTVLQSEGFHHDPCNYNPLGRHWSVLIENNMGDAAQRLDCDSGREHFRHMTRIVRLRSPGKHCRHGFLPPPHPGAAHFVEASNLAQPERDVNARGLHAYVNLSGAA